MDDLGRVAGRAVGHLRSTARDGVDNGNVSGDGLRAARSAARGDGVASAAGGENGVCRGAVLGNRVERATGLAGNHGGRDGDCGGGSGSGSHR